MSFSERRGRRDARVLAVVAVVAAGSLILVAGRASASPIDDPFVTGMSFSGPTSGDLGAIYWNPAALGLMRGFLLMVAGTARWSSVGVSRPASGSRIRATTPWASSIPMPGKSWRKFPTTAYGRTKSSPLPTES